MLSNYSILHKPTPLGKKHKAGPTLLGELLYTSLQLGLLFIALHSLYLMKANFASVQHPYLKRLHTTCVWQGLKSARTNPYLLMGILWLGLSDKQSILCCQGFCLILFVSNIEWAVTTSVVSDILDLVWMFNFKQAALHDIHALSFSSPTHTFTGQQATVRQVIVQHSEHLAYFQAYH